VDYNTEQLAYTKTYGQYQPIISDYLKFESYDSGFYDGKPRYFNTNALNPIKRNELYSDDAANNRKF